MSRKRSCLIWIISVHGCSIQVRPFLSSEMFMLQSYFSHCRFLVLVGYFNYRYFCNFLLYVFLGMFYGAVVSFRPFCAISYQRGRTGNNLWAPAREDEAAIAFSFMLCLSVGLAVLSLGGFHAYLILTAQTTIEFHGTCRKRKPFRRQAWPHVTSYYIKFAHFVWHSCIT
jgi:DHHC palmitoyltransferase